MTTYHARNLEQIRRTEQDALTREAIPVILGGIEFELMPQPKRQSAYFRSELAKIIGSVTAVTKLVGAIEAAFSKTKEIDLSDLPIEDGLKLLAWFFEEGATQALDLVYAYEPSFADDEVREFIENHATDAEVIEVLRVIFGLTFDPLVKSLPSALRAEADDPDAKPRSNGTGTKRTRSPRS